VPGSRGGAPPPERQDLLQLVLPVAPTLLHLIQHVETKLMVPELVPELLPTDPPAHFAEQSRDVPFVFRILVPLELLSLVLDHPDQVMRPIIQAALREEVGAHGR
jgi:hypothetical protein